MLVHKEGRLQKEEPVQSSKPLRWQDNRYAGPMAVCYVGDERVQPQPSGFYGGWITSDVVGPFKGGPGTVGW